MRSHMNTRNLPWRNPRREKTPANNFPLLQIKLYDQYNFHDELCSSKSLTNLTVDDQQEKKFLAVLFDYVKTNKTEVPCYPL